jgi:hypothetical protein
LKPHERVNPGESGGGHEGLWQVVDLKNTSPYLTVRAVLFRLETVTGDSASNRHPLQQRDASRDDVNPPVVQKPRRRKVPMMTTDPSARRRG